MIFPDDIFTSSKSSGRKKTGYCIEGCRIYFTRWLVQGVAFSLPGIGIFLGFRQSHNNLPSGYLNHLIMHEYGHVLQAKDKGLFFYYGIITPISLGSAFWSVLTAMPVKFFKKINFKPYSHHQTWTEWDASRRAKMYFNENDWQEKWFPTQKPMENHNL